MHTLQEMLAMLAGAGYLVYVNRSPVFTSKLYQELGIQSIQSAPIEPVIAPQTVTIAVGVRQPSSDEKKALWHKFVTEAEVPWRVNPGSGSYTVNQYAVGAASKLVRILRDTDIDYESLVESTKGYYKAVDYKVTLKKYLETDMWKIAYDEYKARGDTKRINQGTNRFET